MAISFERLHKDLIHLINNDFKIKMDNMIDKILIMKSENKSVEEIKENVYSELDLFSDNKKKQVAKKETKKETIIPESEQKFWNENAYKKSHFPDIEVPVSTEETQVSEKTTEAPKPKKAAAKKTTVTEEAQPSETTTEAPKPKKAAAKKTTTNTVVTEEAQPSETTTEAPKPKKAAAKKTTVTEETQPSETTTEAPKPKKTASKKTTVTEETQPSETTSTEESTKPKKTIKPTKRPARQPVNKEPSISNSELGEFKIIEADDYIEEESI